jgi:hypothetical protein
MVRHSWDVNRQRGDDRVMTRKFSLRTMALVVAGCGFALAAVASATELWAAVVRDLVLFALTLAVAAALCDRGPRRAFWAGMAIFGWMCFPTVSALLGQDDGLAGYVSRHVALTAHPYLESVIVPRPLNGEETTYDINRKVYGIDSGRKAAYARRAMRDLIALAYGLLGGAVTGAIAVAGKQAGKPGAGPGER